MSNEKKIVLFITLMIGWMIVSPFVMRFLGIEPPPRKPPQRAPNVAAELAKNADADRAAGDAQPQNPGKAESTTAKTEGAAPENGPDAKAQEAKKPEISVVNESELVLGSLADHSPDGYRLEVQLQQNGGGVDSVSSSRYDAEFEDGRVRKRPLQLMRRDPSWPPSLAVTLSPGEGALGGVAANAEGQQEEPEARAKVAESEDLSDSALWEVVRDEKGRIVRPISQDGAEAQEDTAFGQAVVFRSTSRLGLVLTKTFRLWKNSDCFEAELKFESPDKERSFVYNLLGPHGIRIEGEWYTGTFRDVVFGQVGKSDPVTYSAYEVANAKDKPPESTGVPLRYAGVENQYFATLIGPDPVPKDPRDRWDAKTTALVLHKVTDSLQKSDVGVRISSKPITLSPGQQVVHNYRVFAGPKIAESLQGFGPGYEAERLASFHKSQWIPFASDLARHVITPTLSFTYSLTVWVSRLFGGSKGNYGIAIILLTVIVRGLMFPLSRKQARSAQKMQELQPEVKALQEKYKDDKEKATKETMALYSRHGNPQYMGCLPGLIQLPIFVGLWQALNTSVALRHASFLWISDLAAPDMLFRIPFELPLFTYYLGHYFNLLPFAVVGLMVLQTKLFSPPPTTPDAELQQRMMMGMMVFMGFMFYKVASGLGIYFITSSLWAICERLLLPKPKATAAHAHAQVQPAIEAAGPAKAAGSRGGGALAMGTRTSAGGNGATEKETGWLSQLKASVKKVMEEAQKDATYRNMAEDRERRDRDGKSGRDRGRPRNRPGRR
jgi:YidC/Oxa1 family membrane protein insertase